MEELQQLLFKLPQSRQQKLTDLENILMNDTRQDQEKALLKKLNLLEATIKEQLDTHKKADTNNKQHLKDLQAFTEIKETKKTANNKLISTLQEELYHMLSEKEFLKEATKVEPGTKLLEEEEAFSIKQLSLEIKKVTGGWLQFVFTNINRQKLDSCFVFSLKIDEKRIYVAGDCQPEITDMDVLIHKLNCTNDLSTFVRSVRKRFIEMACK